MRVLKLAVCALALTCLCSDPVLAQKKITKAERAAILAKKQAATKDEKKAAKAEAKAEKEAAEAEEEAIRAVVEASRDEVSAQPVDFEVSAGEVEAAWDRAQEWLALFAPTPLTLVTNVAIQTALPAGSWEKGYTVTKIKSASGFRIVINYRFWATGVAALAEAITTALLGPSDVDSPPSAEIDSGDDVSRLLARYIQTGEEGCRNEMLFLALRAGCFGAVDAKGD